MKDITVSKQVLLVELRINRGKHRTVFEKACKVYRERAIEELDIMIQAAKDGDPILRWISIPEPEDHTEDYDRAIKMLEMSVDATINLSEHDFSTFVLDNWGWQKSFAANTVSYTK